MKPVAILMLLSLLCADLFGQLNLRAFHEKGQTFLVWEDNLALGGTDSYSVHRASAPIANVSGTQLVGNIYPADWAAGRLQLSAGAGATLTVPDGAGGTYTLAANEAVLAYTPHAAVPEHFAVVQKGAVVPPATARVGPVTQFVGGIEPHLQFSGIDGGHPFDVYAVWIDGDADPDGGVPGFPIMGNQWFNGTSQLFAVFEPQLGLPPDPLPAVVFLHGGDGSYWKYRPSNSVNARINLNVEDGLYVTLDDNIFLYWNPVTVINMGTRWFGYWSGWNRFDTPNVLPPDDGVIVDYTLRRMDWIIDWLVDKQGVDAQRVSMMGLSNGGRGTLAYARKHPDKLAAGTAFVPPLAPTGVPALAPMGEPGQNLATSLPGGMGMFDFLHPTNLLSDDDLPFLRIIWGWHDASVPWAEDVPAGYPGIPPVIREVNDLRMGTHVYWDQREHVGFGGGWNGAFFVGSPRHDAQRLTGYRSDVSFPAIHDVDHDLATGATDPEPGDPVFPANASPSGTWGGWFDWQPGSVLDRPQVWAATMGLVASSTFPGDIPPLAQATASVTIRRPQQFAPAPWQSFVWTLTDGSSGALLDSGVGAADGQGRVTVPGVLFDNTPDRLRVRLLDGVVPGSDPRASGARPTAGQGAAAPPVQNAPSAP